MSAAPAFAVRRVSPPLDRCHCFLAYWPRHAYAAPCQYQWQCPQTRQGVFGGRAQFTKSPVFRERKCGSPFTQMKEGASGACWEVSNTRQGLP